MLLNVVGPKLAILQENNAGILSSPGMDHLNYILSDFKYNEKL